MKKLAYVFLLVFIVSCYTDRDDFLPDDADQEIIDDERGAKSVRAICTHPVLSGEAYERVEKSKLEELIVTDSIPLRQESRKIKVVSCADLFADVMKSVHDNKSISSKFIM